MATTFADPSDPSDMFRQLAERLSKQATHPDMSGYKPHRKQLAFHQSEAYLRLYLGGNRAGKTHGGVIEDLWWATGRHPFIETPPPPVRIRVVVTDFTQGLGEVMLPKFKALVRPSDLKGGNWDRAYNKQDRKITFKNGSEIQFLSYEQDLQKFAGSSQHAIHFDEEPPKDIYTESAARVVDTEGRMWITMTPVDGITWVYDDLFDPVRNAPDKVISIEQGEHVGPVYHSEEHETTIVEVATEENPFVGAKARERFFKSLSKDERDARSKGQFVSVGGRVFPEFSKETHVIPQVVNPREYFKGWRIITSVDFGMNAPTAWLWHAVSPQGTIVTFWEHYKSQMFVEEHAKMVHAIEKSLGIEVEFRVGDPAGNQQTGVAAMTYVSEYARMGLPIVTEGIPRDGAIGIAKMKQYFALRGRVENKETGEVLDPGKPTWFVTENCVNFEKELRNLLFDKYDSSKTRYKHNKKETVQKKNDHAFDSAKYFATFMHDLAPEEDEIEKFQASLVAKGTVLPYTGTVLRYDEQLVKDQRSREERNDGNWTVIETYS